MAGGSDWKATSGGERPFASCSRLPSAHHVCWRSICMIKPMLLIVDDEKPTREGLRAALGDRFDVYAAEDAATAMELLEKENFAVLLTDFRLPQDDGMKLISRAKSLKHHPVYMLMN